MRFKKILLVGIDESMLDRPYWKRIDQLTQIRKHISKESSNFHKELANTDCLLVNFGIPVTSQDIDYATTLKYIGTLATAYGKVDAAYASKKNIAVCNLAGYSTESVAEFVIAAILEHVRNLEEGKTRAKRGNYSFAGLSAIEIKGKIFGVLGLGSIGKRVAELAQGFGANVRYWSRNRKKDAEKRGIQYEDADTLISHADFLSLNFAQTPETEKFLNRNRIQKLKRGAVVVNTAPMELTDIDALTDRLAKCDITFILDHSDEMDKAGLANLSKYKNCIIYPPIAFISKEARVAKQEIFVGNMVNFLKGTPSNKVN